MPETTPDDVKLAPLVDWVEEAYKLTSPDKEW